MNSSPKIETDKEDLSPEINLSSIISTPKGKGVSNENLPFEYCKNMEINDEIKRIFEKYFDRFPIFCNEDDRDDKGRLERLIKLKGLNCDSEEFDQIYDDLYKKYYYGKFKVEFDDLNFNNASGYLRYFMDKYKFSNIFDEYYWEDIKCPLSLDDAIIEEDGACLLPVFFLVYLFENGILPNDQSAVDGIINEIDVNQTLEFERDLFEESSDSIKIGDVDEMDGYTFESFLKYLFGNMGYFAQNTPLSNDQGADLILTKDSEHIVVQAKRSKNKIGNKAVQEITASIKHYKVERGIVVTNNEFSDQAIVLAHSNDIELMNRDRLIKLLSKYPVSRSKIIK